MHPVKSLSRFISKIVHGLDLGRLNTFSMKANELRLGMIQGTEITPEELESLGFVIYWMQFSWGQKVIIKVTKEISATEQLIFYNGDLMLMTTPLKSFNNLEGPGSVYKIADGIKDLGKLEKALAEFESNWKPINSANP